MYSTVPLTEVNRRSEEPIYCVRMANKNANTNDFQCQMHPICNFFASDAICKGKGTTAPLTVRSQYFFWE